MGLLLTVSGLLALSTGVLVGIFYTVPEIQGAQQAELSAWHMPASNGKLGCCRLTSDQL